MDNIDSMVDRIARAFCELVGDDPDDPKNLEMLEMWEGYACVAIKTMREPTPAMIRAASAFPDSDGALYALPGRMLDWHAMIDAALKEWRG